MDFYEVFDHVLALLRQRGRVSAILCVSLAGDVYHGVVLAHRVHLQHG
jgi:hypothetical protein